MVEVLMVRLYLHGRLFKLSQITSFAKNWKLFSSFEKARWGKLQICSCKLFFPFKDFSRPCSVIYPKYRELLLFLQLKVALDIVDCWLDSRTYLRKVFVTTVVTSGLHVTLFCTPNCLSNIRRSSVRRYEQTSELLTGPHCLSIVCSWQHCIINYHWSGHLSWWSLVHWSL